MVNAINRIYRHFRFKANNQKIANTEIGSRRNNMVMLTELCRICEK